MTIKRCPRCGMNVRLNNELQSWQCPFCGKGAVTVKCPKCKLWVVDEYEMGRPPAVECSACGTLLSV